jgi:sec-independent protein translocase protein TatA
MLHLSMFGRIGFQELLIVLIALLLVFGPSKLPGLARALGGSLHQFRKGLREDPDEERRGPSGGARAA